MMNPKQLVKLTNTVGIVSFVLLIYWIFVFILVQVFNLKIFRLDGGRADAKHHVQPDAYCRAW